jgi:putative transposase
MVARHFPAESLLTGLAKTVIEAALEAELVEHLGYQKYDPAGRTRGSNSRNGSRSKVVRTVLGPVRIDAPRDRWGTFDPATVGKWRREVVGVDRVLLPLAARDAPPAATVELLARVYPSEVPERTLRRIATTARERLAEWHGRGLDPSYACLEVRRSAIRDRQGQVAGFPFVSVVGTTLPDERGGSRRELVSLHAAPGTGRADNGTERWIAVLADLRRRGVRDVRRVASNHAEVHQHLRRAWPGVEVTRADRPAPRPAQRDETARSLAPVLSAVM